MIPRFKVIKRNTIPRLVIQSQYSTMEVTLFPTMVKDLMRTLEPYAKDITQ